MSYYQQLLVAPIDTSVVALPSTHTQTFINSTYTVWVTTPIIRRGQQQRLLWNLFLKTLNTAFFVSVSVLEDPRYFPSQYPRGALVMLTRRSSVQMAPERRKKRKPTLFIFVKRCFFNSLGNCRRNKTTACRFQLL